MSCELHVNFRFIIIVPVDYGETCFTISFVTIQDLNRTSDIHISQDILKKIVRNWCFVYEADVVEIRLDEIFIMNFNCCKLIAKYHRFF